MKYVGSDIVSLKNSDNIKSFSNEKYLKKILVDNEYEVSLKKGVHPAVFWSCKESVYKVLCKMGYTKPFVPGLFQVEIYEQNSKEVYSKVSFEGLLFYCHTEINNDYVISSSVVSPEEINKVKNVIIQGKTLKTEKIEAIISEQLKINSEFHITKDWNNIPRLQGINNADISLSHDGDFHAITLLLN